MNLILLFPEDMIDGTHTVRLQGRRFDHVLKIHRASLGDELCVGMVNGRIGTGRIISLNRTSIEMEIGLGQEPPAPLPITIVLALPRPKVLRRVLRMLSMLGVKRIFLMNCFRVEKSYWQSPFLREEAVREQLVLGLEQARDTVLPEVSLRPLFKPFAEDELPQMIQGTVPLVGHPDAGAPCPRDLQQAVTLAIGPEGGFTQYELDKFFACGFKQVRMGERILSVETVVPALISRLF